MPVDIPAVPAGFRAWERHVCGTDQLVARPPTGRCWRTLQPGAYRPGRREDPRPTPTSGLSDNGPERQFKSGGQLVAFSFLSKSHLQGHCSHHRRMTEE